MTTILIIDDSPTDVHVYGTMLKKNGFEVESAPNAEDGIALAKSSQPDLILMDVIMPGMNGFQATRSLSKDPVTENIPVIIVSTKNMETDRVWGMRQGAKDYVTKPVKDAVLIQKPQHRVLRGGSWMIEAKRHRSANREYYEPIHRSGYSGFRVLLEMVVEPESTEID